MPIKDGIFLWNELTKNLLHYHLATKYKKSELKQCWLENYKAANEYANQLPNKLIVSIADREGDIYEIYNEANKMFSDEGAKTHYLIRGKTNRKTCNKKESKGINGCFRSRELDEEKERRYYQGPSERNHSTRGRIYDCISTFILLITEHYLLLPRQGPYMTPFWGEMKQQHRFR